jgi:hypothetical protein
MGAFAIKYSFSKGSFWEWPFCPKTAIMGAERTSVWTGLYVGLPPER